MTITTQTNKAQATGNGSVKTFTYSFPIQSLSHVEVYLGNTLQASGYTVAGIGDPAGGSVTFTVAPAAGVQVTILRVVPLTQQVDYSPYDAFPAETHEGALDKLTTITQQMQEELDRAWKVPIDTAPGVDIDPPPYEAGKVLAWSDTLPNVLVNQPGIGTFTQLHDEAVAAASAAAASETAAAGSASAAAGSASTASTQAGIAATQAGIATTQAGIATDKASEAAGDASAAAASSQAATASAAEAVVSANTAGTKATEASASAAIALASENKAEKWAQEAEDVPVTPGEFSAFHWAQKASEIVANAGGGNVSGPASSVGGHIATFADATGKLITDGGPIQADVVDATVGALLKVGAFGENGGPSIEITTGSCNDIVTPGEYIITMPGVTEGPSTLSQAAFMSVHSRANGVILQECRPTNANTANQSNWFRTRANDGVTWAAWRQYWTDKNLVKQASATDVTAGALMAVGAFGLGSVNTPWVTYDLNTIAATGFYFVSGAASTNLPSAGAFGFLTHIGRGVDGYQTFTVAGVPDIAITWYRTKVASVWGAWQRVVTGVKQANATDTTAGALLVVGSFGLGAAPSALADANTAVATGFYRANTATLNIPAAANFVMWVNAISSINLVQIASRTNTGETYIRFNNGGTWGAWQELATLNAARTVPLSTTAGTLVLADKGKCVDVTAASITVPSGVFAAGDVVSIYCNSLTSISIIAGAGLTMATAGGGGGNRTLSTRGIATLWFTSGSFVICNGAGVS